MTTIGVAYDGSDEAQAALLHAAVVAQALDARLEIIGVVARDVYETPVGVGGFMTPYEEITHAVQVRLEDALHSLPIIVDAKTVRLLGEPVQALADHSEQLDLLVTGSRGYGSLRSAIVGGVSQRLIRSAHCPVTVVPRTMSTHPV
jgi:nucleotide-binding universal stress UspA family protein